MTFRGLKAEKCHSVPASDVETEKVHQFLNVDVITVSVLLPEVL